MGMEFLQNLSENAGILPAVSWNLYLNLFFSLSVSYTLSPIDIRHTKGQ